MSANKEVPTAGGVSNPAAQKSAELCSRHTGDGADEDHRDASRQEWQALVFLHQARTVRDLDPAQVARVARRLRRSEVRPRRALLWPALAVVVLTMVAGAALAVAQGGLHALPIVSSLFSPEPPSHRKDVPHGRHVRVLPKASVPDPSMVGSSSALSPSSEPTVTPAPTAPAVPPHAAPQQGEAATPLPSPREPQRRVAPREPETFIAYHRERGSDRSGEAQDPIVAEGRSFAAVIESWHHRHDADAALGLLDAHEHRFPAGGMGIEARVLRAEILLAQSREADALNVLETVSLWRLPRARELQTVRGELLAKAGRCPEARADLGSVLEKNVADGLAQRAARALSHCP